MYTSCTVYTYVPKYYCTQSGKVRLHLRFKSREISFVFFSLPLFVVVCEFMLIFFHLLFKFFVCFLSFFF